MDSLPIFEIKSCSHKNKQITAFCSAIILNTHVLRIIKSCQICESFKRLLIKENINKLDSEKLCIDNQSIVIFCNKFDENEKFTLFEYFKNCFISEFGTKFCISPNIFFDISDIDEFFHNISYIDNTKLTKVIH
ncbi:Hypothetical protein KVN_LOCUS433 [uncultured virus]|nr:Hypothetical protein KVN_LOCUS433 [uncultured virus]